MALLKKKFILLEIVLSLYLIKNAKNSFDFEIPLYEEPKCFLNDINENTLVILDWKIYPEKNNSIFNSIDKLTKEEKDSLLSNIIIYSYEHQSEPQNKPVKLGFQIELDDLIGKINIPLLRKSFLKVCVSYKNGFKNLIKRNNKIIPIYIELKFLDVNNNEKDKDKVQNFNVRRDN